MGKDAERGKYASPEGSRTWEYLVTFTCGIGLYCIGNLQGWSSPTITELKSPNSRIQITNPASQLSWLAAALSTGHMAAPIFSLLLIDRIGRKNSFLLSAVPLVFSWALIVGAEHINVLIAARVLAGFSMGLMMCVYPAYFGEIFSTELRGFLTCITIAAYNFGVLAMFAVAPYLGIRTTGIICMTITITFLITFWFMPESPYFLMMVGKTDQAESALEKLRGKTDVSDELELVKTTLREKGKSLLGSNGAENNEMEPGMLNTLKRLFTIRGNLKALIITMLIGLLSHCCGFGSLMAYCHVIFTDMNAGIDVQITTIFFSLLQLIASVVGTIFVEKAGRRTFMLGAGVLSGFLLTIVAGYFFLMEHTTVDVSAFALFAVFIIYNFIFVAHIGLLMVPGIIVSEIFSTDIKVLASCIGGIFGSAVGVVSTKYYFLMAKSWGFGHSVPFFIYAIVTWLSTACIGYLLPETKGKTLYEIQKILNA